jgi:hypothetical protein
VTRRAVAAGFESFVDDAIAATADEFSVSRALAGASGPADRLLERSDALDRRVVRPELRSYRRSILDQFDATLDHAEAVAAGGEPDHREALLASDPFADALRPDLAPARRERLRDRLLARQHRLAEATVPLLEHPAEEFWPAVVGALDRPTAAALVGEQFRFTEPVVADRDAFAFTTRIDTGDLLPLPVGPTITVEYTDEAVRAMRVAEAQVIEAAEREIDRRF